MSFTFEPFKQAEHLEEIDKWISFWWKDKAPLPVRHLPSTGYVVRQDKLLLAAGWLYVSNSLLGWMEWIVVNPQALKPIRNEALDMLISGILNKAAIYSVEAVVMSTPHLSLARKIKSLGFTVLEDNTTTYVRDLGV